MNSNVNLGQLIPSAKIRKVIWGAWVVLTLLIGAIPAAYAAIGLANPEWLEATWAIVAYLNIPLATLAFANTPSKEQPEVSEVVSETGTTYVINLPTTEDPTQV